MNTMVKISNMEPVGAPAIAQGTKVVARDVNVYYGEKRALFRCQPRRSGTFGDGPHRSVRLRKVDVLRCLNRMNDTIPIARVTGRIEIDGRDIYNSDLDVVQLRANVGMVFQKPNPFPKSIYENVAYGPRIHRFAKSKPDLDGSSNEVCVAPGLWEEVKDRLQQRPPQLSGGQQQRLVHCPRRSRSVPRSS